MSIDDRSDAVLGQLAQRAANAAARDRPIAAEDDDPWSAFVSEATLSGRGADREANSAPMDDRIARIDAWPVPLPQSRLASRRWVLGAVALVTGIAALAWGYVMSNWAVGVQPAGFLGVGKATITSRPEGLQVVIDDQVRGSTPLTLALPLGSHQLRIQAGTEVRSIPLTITADTLVSQYIELGAASSVPGGLEAGEPSGSGVKDALVSGRTPHSPAGSAIGDRPAGSVGGERLITRAFTKLPGVGTSIDAASSSRLADSGWVTFKAPFEMQVLEDGHLVGTTGPELDRLMLPAGPHRLELVSESLEFRTTVGIQIAAGVASTREVSVPEGLLSLNAVPWADVRIDGTPAGTTPLANLAVEIGSHDIVWTNPQHGERRQTVVVKAKTPTRVGLNFGQ